MSTGTSVETHQRTSVFAQYCKNAYGWQGNGYTNVQGGKVDDWQEADG